MYYAVHLMAGQDVFYVHFLRALGFYGFYPIETVAAKYYPVKQVVNEIATTFGAGVKRPPSL